MIQLHPIADERRAPREAEAASREPTLYSLFDAQAAAHSERTAVVDARGNHTYARLASEARALALDLCARGAAPNTPIAVLCEKGFHQVVGVLGILGSGAAYLPLDPTWPVGRLEEILERASVSILVASRAQLDRVRGAGLSSRVAAVVVDEPRPTPSATARVPQVRRQDIAYVIFTSGSTGRPKGAVISHDNALTTINAVNARFDVTANDRVLAVSRLSFDLSVYDIFGMLHAGGTIVFPEPDRASDPSHWRHLIQTHSVTLWNTVPQLMQLLVDTVDTDRGAVRSLRCVLLSGDWIALSLPDRVKRVAPRATVVSLGGATEGSVWSIWYEIDRVDPAWKSIPYGFAMPDQQIHVLDEHGSPCAVAETGNIYIGGRGVALGYWDDPEQTARSFEHHPVYGPLFRTGDLGCLHARGHVEFLGRRDHQVKLNGYRIELEEIAAKLSSHPGIAQAVVLVKKSDSGAPHLAAYYVADQPVDSAELREMLAHHLPPYMVPRSYHALAGLPLTTNGKIERDALLSLEEDSGDAHVPPRTELETTLCRMWAQHLGAERFGMTDDFFCWGGDSLGAIKLACAMSKELSRFVDPSLIAANPRVEAILSALDTDDDPIEIRRVDHDLAPLSFQQEAALDDERRRPGLNAFPMAFEVVDETALPHLFESLGHIVRQQSALRTLCRRDDRGIWRQVVSEHDLVVEERWVTTTELEQIYQDVYHGRFDLTSELPIRASVLRTETSVILLVVVHHIAFDGWSIGAFVDDLAAALQSYRRGHEPTDARSDAIRYSDYAHWQRRWSAGARLDAALGFWREKFAGYRPFVFPDALPPTLSCKSTADPTQGRLLEFELDPATSEALRRLAREGQTTLFAVLLAALYGLLYRRTGQRDLALASMLANRPRAQVQQLIGNFSNTRGCRLQVDGTQSVSTLIARVHAMLVESAEHSGAPFAQVVEEVAGGATARSLFPVRLNVHDFRARMAGETIQRFLQAMPLHRYFDIATYDVDFVVNPGAERIKGFVIYATSRYERRFAEQLTDDYLSILRRFAAGSEVAVNTLLDPPSNTDHGDA